MKKRRRIDGRIARLLSLSTVLLLLFGLLGGMCYAAGSAQHTTLSAQVQISLTEEERAYLAANPTLVVAADGSWRPIEYRDEETGIYSGIIPEIFRRLAAYTGLKVEYLVQPDYAQALACVQNGDADLISGLADSAEMAAEYHVTLSDPYLQINSAIVSKDGVDGLYSGGKDVTIAVVAGDYANASIREKIPSATLVECASTAACFDEVLHDEADLALVASYSAEYYIGVPKYSSLESHTISDFSWHLAFGVRQGADPRLVSILNKGIEQMESYDINEAVYEGVIHARYDNDWMILLYRHPLAVISAVVAVVGVFAALLLVLAITRRRSQMRMLEDGTRLRLALERTHLCIWEYDLVTHRITQVDNPQERHGFCELRDNIPESVIEAGYIHPEDVEQVKTALQRVGNGEQDVAGRWRIRDARCKQGDSVYWWEQVLFHLVTDERGRPVKAIGVSEDITREMDSQRDSLTLVYNRKSFEQMAGNVLNERRHAYLQCAFLILDLDGFKQINDTYGHGMGDRVLISVGTALQKTFRSTDIVGRLGGDEFTVFMTSISKTQDATVKAQELVKNISRLQERENFPSPSPAPSAWLLPKKTKGRTSPSSTKMPTPHSTPPKRRGKTSTASTNKRALSIL